MFQNKFTVHEINLNLKCAIAFVYLFLRVIKNILHELLGRYGPAHSDDARATFKFIHNSINCFYAQLWFYIKICCLKDFRYLCVIKISKSFLLVIKKITVRNSKSVRPRLTTHAQNKRRVKTYLQITPSFSTPFFFSKNAPQQKIEVTHPRFSDGTDSTALQVLRRHLHTRTCSTNTNWFYLERLRVIGRELFTKVRGGVEEASRTRGVNFAARNRIYFK